MQLSLVSGVPTTYNAVTLSPLIPNYVVGVPRTFHPYTRNNGDHRKGAREGKTESCPPLLVCS
ncbi:hypothetical protein QTN47_20085 [Danxiaibacter flavus]|uniref:Uncharacterized protein n=1 Tax=Danxiaibacter flavus TaxID=3049108 RepID=A0ABV3ZIV0_9BACT|nr:hypothetical protein QNM32_20095 [Chitinophagaceae bacterium DXS]